MWPDGIGPSPEPARTSTGSEVVVISDQMIEPSHEIPTIANMNIQKSSGIHIGHKFVTVSQTVHKNEVVKGRLLGLELVSPSQSRRLRCSVAIFVCWALVVASGLAIYFFCFALNKEQTSIDIDLNETWYLRRADWQAQPPSSAYNKEFLSLPVKIVTIGHSAFDSCSQKRTCINEVKRIQRLHLERFGEIGPNFLVGGTDGLIFEGVGANVIGATITYWNRKMIAIMFLGDYSIGKNMPNQNQIDHVATLLEVLVRDNILHPQYKLYGYCQILTHTIPPGWNIMKKLPNFPHWNDENSTTCRKDLSFRKYLWDLFKNSTRAERLLCSTALGLVVLCIVMLIVYFTVIAKIIAKEPDIAPHEWWIQRDDWLAQPYNNTPLEPRYEPARLVIVQHTVSAECHTFLKCASEIRILQDYCIEERDGDVPYNFFIGNDGRVYEGRGWQMEGAHTRGYNRCSVGLGFIGDYRGEKGTYTKVTAAQENRTQMILDDGVRLGYLDPNYAIVAASDVQITESPGSNLVAAMKRWPHYDHLYRFRNKTCDEIISMEFNKF